MTLPTYRSLEARGVKIFAAHGSPRNRLYGYLKPSLPQDESVLALTTYRVRPKPVDAELVIVSHTHIQADFRLAQQEF